MDENNCENSYMNTTETSKTKPNRINALERIDNFLEQLGQGLKPTRFPEPFGVFCRRAGPDGKAQSFGLLQNKEVNEVYDLYCLVEEHGGGWNEELDENGDRSLWPKDMDAAVRAMMAAPQYPWGHRSCRLDTPGRQLGAVISR